MKIGFVGLGDQGGAMAERLIDTGHSVTVWARRADVRDRFAARGAAVAANAAGAATGCDMLELCVGNEADVRELLFDRGMLGALGSGAIVAVHSTISPDACTEIARQCEARQVGFLDAPVSGSGHGARAGTLLLLAGGVNEVLDRARPAFSAFAGTILHIGGVGAGMRTKLINNLLSAAQIGLAQMALDVGASMELDLAMLRECVLAGTGQSYGMDALIRLHVPERATHIAAILEKDVALARQSMGGINGQASALVAAADLGVAQIWALARGEGGLLPSEILEVVTEPENN